MFTEAFIAAYPAPWSLHDGEVVDADGCNVQHVETDMPEDRDFWQNVVNAVNATSARAIVPDEELLRLGERVVEMASLVSAARPGAEAAWHFEIDEDRYRVAIRTAEALSEPGSPS